MRSSGGLRWRPGGCSGRDSATLPSVPRRGACSRPPSLCSTTAPDRRRMLADRSVGHACRRTAAHLPDRRRGAWPGTTGGTRLTARPLTGRSAADMRPSSFRRATGPRHTTQEHPFEVVIHYPHHPRAGECVVAFRRVIHGGRLHYAIEQTNACRVLLPAWMTESGAAALPMVEVPRLSLASLRELRGLVETRSAYVYVRQSTPDQLANNPESRRRQYALADRARALGWENVIVIDDDLGRSGGGTARPGLERLLAAICTGSAGAVLAIEASRLARNGRDWHTLLEFSTLVSSLIIDEDGIYDPKLINDRLLLGMKGTFSELELSILRQRSQEALRLKAARGDLHTSVAVGYVRSCDDRLELDPNRRVRDVLSLAFKKFAEIGSIRQLALWLNEECIKMPMIVYGPRGRMVEWRLPRYNTMHRLLTNPIYAGAYAFGRTGSQIHLEAGRKVITRGVRRTQDTWEVLIREHHEGYIFWEEYERNQRILSGNANMKGDMVPGSVRNGGGLLAGLLRCGHCGRKLKVKHHGLRGVTRYLCNEGSRNFAQRTKCIGVGNMRIDAAVSGAVLRVIAPLGLDAALQAIADRERSSTERLRQMELALEKARYEAARAHRQYDAVEPENRVI